ncbi:SMI1/KNR4 family protein [Streptomyces sp. NPDC031705]|uniref:SMI1/KNR4 family protein n=1 Tax=unclassified Streptomyces TaxID=2593676 RepID=UPI0034055E5A
MPPRPAPLRPPLTEAEVADAERELGVRFPAEYRAYLRDTGIDAGGYRVVRTDAGWRWPGDDRLRRDLLTEPFPHPDSYARADAELCAREPDEADFPDLASYLAAWAAWDAECEEFEDRRTAGALCLQEHGCGFSTLLAVSGPLAGTMWWDGRASCDLIVPLSLDHAGAGRPATFGEWLGRDSWDLLPDRARPRTAGRPPAP